MFSDFIEEFKGSFSGLGRVLVVTHANADPDGLASAVLALKLVETLGSRGCIGIPDGLSKVSKALVGNLSLDLEFCEDIFTFDGCIVVDSSNPVQLGVFKEACLRARSKALIDHHEPGLLGEAIELKLLDPGAPSTTELLVLLLYEAGVRLDSREATLATAGIIYDSRRFIDIGPHTFKAMNILLDWGCNYTLALKSMIVERGEVEGFSRRVSILKALSRLRLERACHNLLVTVTHIGSNESEVARTLVSLGADIAIVVAGREDGARVAVRVSERALAMGVKASTIASYIASKYSGEGGGHDSAAMAHIGLEDEIEKITDSIARSIAGKTGRICQANSQGSNA